MPAIDIIDQFMWGFQRHFRGNIEFRTRYVLEAIGFEGTAEVLLVGLARDGHSVRHQVCVEPEEGRWAQSMFATLPSDAELAAQNHPDRLIFYSDEQTSREQPERIRRRAISETVARLLADDDLRAGVKSFCSDAIPYQDYYVVTVIQLSATAVAALPVIRYTWMREDQEMNLLTACIGQILEQAEIELCRATPAPGQGLADSMRLDAGEIIARAARSLMRRPFIGDRDINTGLFEPIEEVSKLLYEGSLGEGGLILAERDDPRLVYLLHLEQPVPIHNARWLRKLLQMASGDAALVTDYKHVYGLATLADAQDPPYRIDVAGPQKWDLRRGQQHFIRVTDGRPRLPQEPIPAARLRTNARRIFPEIDEADAERMHEAMDILLSLGRGGMVVFAADAASEAERLERQGSRIRPTMLSRELLERATMIDGSILADPRGQCHAIGVILDGGAVSDCTPERGSRYNSAVRYVAGGASGRMAFVVSEDAMLDVVPLLLPQVDRDEMEAKVVALEAATLDTYHAPRNILSSHRFYLDADQCSRINDALDRIEEEPREVGQLVWITPRFAPDPAMNDSYFISTAG